MHIRSNSNNFRQRIVPATLLLIALGCGIYIAIYLVMQYSATHGPIPKVQSQIVSNSSDEPAETQPDCANYRTADTDPRLIKFPSIDKEGCILKVDIDQNNAIAVPNNIHLAGWFIHSAKPGEKGVSIIDGHVSGKYSPGVFKDLHKLKAGDSFLIEFGNKKTKSFKIVDTLTLSVDDTTKKMYEQIPGIEYQVNLITCTGAFNKETQQYEKRILVRATAE